MDNTDLTIKEATEALRNKKLSAVELVQSCLSRIKEYDSKIHGFLTVDEKGALEQAQVADSLLKNGSDKKLLGIPIALKDIFSTKKIRTTAGAKLLSNFISPYDATVVTKLKQEGAVIIGKTNLDAWAHGSSGENTDFEATHNPYDLSRVPGGSSSGSGAAVAASMCLATTGTDTGGSVRLPAAFCNLVGLKPTYGRVSRYGIIAMASSFDTIGHMSKTVYDNALITEITAGKDLYDATTLDAPVPQYTKLLGTKFNGLKVGLPKEYFDVAGIEPEIRKVTEEALDQYKKLGITFVPISLPHTDYAMACYYILCPSEVSSNLARFDGVRYGLEREFFGAEAKRRIMLGTHTLSVGYYDAFYLQAAKIRTLIKKDFDEAFSQVDLIMTPVSPTVPFKIGEKIDNPLAMYLSDIFMCPVNIAGVPGLSVPCGFVGQLPVGLQIIGPQLSEEKLYNIACAYEQIAPWYKQSPKNL